MTSKCWFCGNARWCILTTKHVGADRQNRPAICAGCALHAKDIANGTLA